MRRRAPSPPTWPNRTRSGCARCPSTQLANPPQTRRHVDVDGVTYNVKSEAKWITDDLGGTPACGNSTRTRSSTCTSSRPSPRRSSASGSRRCRSTRSSRRRPTTPRTTARSASRSSTASGAKGVAGHHASTRHVAGYSPPTETTDANGCVVFDGVPVGDLHGDASTSPATSAVTSTRSRRSTARSSRKTVSFVKMLQYDKADHRPRHGQDAHARARRSRPPTSRRRVDLRCRPPTAPTSACCGRSRRRPPATTIDSAALYPVHRDTPTRFFTGELRLRRARRRTRSTQLLRRPPTRPAALLGDPAQPQPQAVTVLPAAVQRPRSRATATTTQRSPTSTSWSTRRCRSRRRSTETATRTATGSTARLTPMARPAALGHRRRGSTATTHNHWVSQRAATFDPGMPFGKYTLCVVDTDAASRYHDRHGLRQHVGRRRRRRSTSRRSWTTTTRRRWTTPTGELRHDEHACATRTASRCPSC